MYSTLSTLNNKTEAHCSGCVCSLLCVCTLDGLNAEHKFRVWVTILGRMSRHFHFPNEVNSNITLKKSSHRTCLETSSSVIHSFTDLSRNKIKKKKMMWLCKYQKRQAPDNWKRFWHRASSMNQYYTNLIRGKGNKSWVDKVPGCIFIEVYHRHGDTAQWDRFWSFSPKQRLQRETDSVRERG